MPLDLNDLLSEGAASGGFWQSLGGLDVDFDDNVDLSSVEESDLYDFLYTVIGANNCQDTALIQLNLQVIPDSGEDTTTTLCSAGEEYLFDFLDDHEIENPIAEVDYDLLMLEPGDGRVTKPSLFSTLLTERFKLI